MWPILETLDLYVFKAVVPNTLCQAIPFSLYLNSTMSSTTMVPVFQRGKSIKAHSDNVNSLAFSEDGQFLASGGDDGYISIFKTNSWHELRKYRTVSPVRAIRWHPGNNGVITAGLKSGIVITIQIKVQFNCLYG